jgi:hypothetical protein
MADLITDPAGWAQKTVGTKLKLYVFSGLHVLIFISTMIWYEGQIHNGPYMAFLWFGVGMPIIYLYAIHRLIKVIEDRNR